MKEGSPNSVLSKMYLKHLPVLFNFPRSVIVREVIHELSDVHNKKNVIIGINVESYNNPFMNFATRNKPFVINCNFFQAKNIDKARCAKDDREKIQLMFFNGKVQIIRRIFELDENYIINGKLNCFSFGGKKRYNISHPKRIMNNSVEQNLPENEIIYPHPRSTEYIDKDSYNKKMKNLIQFSLKNSSELSEIAEWIPEKIIRQKGWLSFFDSIEKSHNPTKESDLTIAAPPSQRLIFDEILYQQLKIHLYVKENKINAPVITKKENRELNIGFDLTASQKKAIEEINSDLNSKESMVRLLHGDVGSGKTIVALIVADNVIGSNYQVAFLAPTDILAHQHYLSAVKLLKGKNVCLYTSNQKGKTREKILSDVATGAIDLLIGTHSLIQNCVVFKNLGLIIIDEQQRFGVIQRMKLAQQGVIVPHTLSLSATPIPRTLLLSQQKNIKMSYLLERPANRKKIETSIISMSKINDLVKALKKIVERKEQIYWVCALVDENDKDDIISVKERTDFLHKTFGEKVSCVHGKMKNDEKQKVMKDFYDGKISILVATTVIEIGLDALMATVIVIENPERFGLSQLHQLRGRVGRNKLDAYCILLFSKDISITAKKRLNIIKHCDDGFIIAEKDLLMRGAGDVFGTEQSGNSILRSLPNITTKRLMENKKDVEIFKNIASLASQTADEIIEKGTESSENIKALIEIFNTIYDEEDCFKTI